MAQTSLLGLFLDAFGHVPLVRSFKKNMAIIDAKLGLAAIAASLTGTFSGVGTAADTITVGAKVYTLRAAPTTVANEVKIGGTAAITAQNLVNAINGGTGSGTLYGSLTVAHTLVTAARSGNDVIVTAIDGGVDGNAIAVDESGTGFSWAGGAVFLAGGIDQTDSHAEVVSLRTQVASLTARRYPLQLRVATLVGSNVYRAVVPFAGTIKKISSVIELALTTGDATLTAKIGTTAITTGVLTITQAGSAAGDVDSCLPSAANVVAAGDMISLTVGGSNAAAAVANCVFEIERA